MIRMQNFWAQKLLTGMKKGKDDVIPALMMKSIVA